MATRTYYYGLDLIRFASALSVAVFHMFFWSWAGVYSTIDQTNHLFGAAANFQQWAALTWFGWVGVEVFFVISGFVIAQSANTSSPMKFLAGRMLRLYPAVWVCATATLAVLYFVARDPLSVLLGPYLKSLLLVPRSRWIDGVYWTLAVEILFYALVFLILFFKWISLVHVAWVLTFWSAIYNAVYLPIVSGAVHLPAMASFLRSHVLEPALFLLPNGCQFALGIWLWLAANGKMAKTRWVGLAIALVASRTEVYARASDIRSIVPAAIEQSPIVPLAVFLVATLLIAVFTRSRAQFIAASGRTGTLLRYLGLMTYPFYLVHNLVGAGISRLLIEVGMNGALAVCVALTYLLFMCWVFCWKLETRVRSLMLFGFSILERTILRARRVAAVYS
jgi:peptidoglycan/LPS O-acetylase OafA/YrhL